MTHETNQPQKNAHRATQGLDPGCVDNGCQVVEVPLAGGQSVPVSMQTVAPLTDEDRQALGEIARAVIEREERVNPHGGVIQELAASSFHARRVVRDAGEPELADRQQRAVKAAMDVVRAAGVDRESRFRWAEEAARLDDEIAQVAELLAVPAHLLHGPTPPTVVDLARWARAGRDSFDRRLADLQAEFAKHVEVHDRQLAKAATELAELRQRAVLLPDGWRERVMDAIGECDGEVLIELVESWRPTDATTVVDEFIATDGQSGALSDEIDRHVTAIVDRATGERHEYPQSSANNCGCPGSGTSAHTSGCELHPEADRGQ